jgi:hypothetical protein
LAGVGGIFEMLFLACLGSPFQLKFALGDPFGVVGTGNRG